MSIVLQDIRIQDKETKDMINKRNKVEMRWKRKRGVKNL